MPEQPQTPSGWLPPQAPEGHPPPRFEAPAFQPPRPSPPPVAAARAKRAGPANGLAIAASAFGVAGLLLLVFSLGLGFFFALPCSIAAWVLGVHATRRIAEGSASSGAGQARAGRLLGMAGVALGLIAMIVWVVLIASGFSIEKFQRDLERKLEQQRHSSAQTTWPPTRTSPPEGTA